LGAVSVATTTANIYKLHRLPRSFDRFGYLMRTPLQLACTKDGYTRCSQYPDNCALILYQRSTFIDAPTSTDLQTCWIVIKNSHTRHSWICEVRSWKENFGSGGKILPSDRYTQLFEAHYKCTSRLATCLGGYYKHTFVSRG
jgi:hypothetical protein